MVQVTPHLSPSWASVVPVGAPAFMGREAGFSPSPLHAAGMSRNREKSALTLNKEKPFPVPRLKAIVFKIPQEANLKRVIPATLTLLLAACATQEKPPAPADDMSTSQPVPTAPTSPGPTAQNNAEATVVMKADISKDGHNVNCRIISSEKPDLDDISLDYCRNEKYRRPIKNGVPVIEHDHLVTVKYHVDK
ncbi:energy transducer TonB [Acetobacter malorum]|uniref:energy transducer TonB n=1 Tax=Acetobacter malorum TaxID=178901 RepID=UPI0039EC13CC